MTPIIPEMHTLGSINPHTLFMELNRASMEEIIEARAGGGATRGWEIYEHEARHWLDLLSTVWGREYLDLLFRAYDAILVTPERQMETTFALLLELFDRDRAILFPTYYKYVLPEAKLIRPEDRWSLSFSTGVKVGSNGELDPTRPFIFARFDAGGEHFSRQPVSEGSLLEARALAAEVAAVTDWLKKRPEGEDVVTWKLREADDFSLFFDPELTTYSVAPHIVSYAAGATQVRSALSLAHKLSDIALNLTEAGFRTLAPTRELPDPDYPRLRGFRRTKNRGYAFCCMAFALRGLRGEFPFGRDQIDRAMRDVGLPSIARIYSEARAALERVPRRLARDERLAVIRRKLIEAGSALHREPDFDASVAPLCPSGDLPAPMFGDSECEVGSLGRSPLTLDDLDYLHECSVRYREVLRAALRAARGFEFEFTDFVY